MGRKKRKIRRVDNRKLIRFELIMLAIIAVSATMLALALSRYIRDRGAYQSARERAVSTPAPSVEPTQALTPEPQATPTPVPLETPPILVDFEAIRTEGRHVRGWLYSEGTIINYPVVYYSNNEYYLTHDYAGNRSNAGALFYDTRVQKELLGDNIIIYGHHMKDRSMFGSLLQYQKQAYYDEHPTMYLLTLDGNYRIDLFAARFTESDAEDFQIWFASDKAREAYVRSAISNSDFAPLDTAYRADSTMITLATCAYSNYIEDAKYQVLGWLTPIG